MNQFRVQLCNPPSQQGRACVCLGHRKGRGPLRNHPGFPPTKAQTDHPTNTHTHTNVSKKCEQKNNIIDNKQENPPDIKTLHHFNPLLRKSERSIHNLCFALIPQQRYTLSHHSTPAYHRTVTRDNQVWSWRCVTTYSRRK